MPINIFQVDPNAAARPRKRMEIVGRFRSGTQLNNRPVALDAWRVTTGDPDVADRVAALLGGTPEEWKETKTEEKIEVFTEANSVQILVGEGQLRSSLGMWNRANVKIRSCDGITQGSPNTGEPCVCPTTLEDRKVAEKEGTGCSPEVVVFFRLADAPDLGTFKFQTQAWGPVKLLPSIMEDLDRVFAVYPLAVVRMWLEKVEYTTKSGQERKYTAWRFDVEGGTEEPED